MTRRALTRFCLAAALALGGAGTATADGFADALRQALLQSKTIAAARLDLRSAIEDLPAARATMSTITELGAAASTTEQRVGPARRSNDSDTESVTLTLRQPLYDGGVARAQKTVAELAVERAEARLELDEQSVLLAAIDAYVGLVVARDRAELEKANASRLDEYLRATELRVELGEGTPTDLAATQAQRARARASRITAETRLVNAEETYRSLMGEPAAALALPAVPPGLPASADAAGEAALKGNHAHRLAYIAERAARRNLDVLVANVRPRVNASVTGRSTDSSDNGRDTEEVTASLTLSMPLFPNSAVRARARSGVASHQAALFSLRDSERSTRLAAQNAYRNFRASSQVIDAYAAELKGAALLRDGTAREVEFGLKTVLDLLDAEQGVVNAQVNLLDANRGSIVAAYALLAAVGGLSAPDLGLGVDVAAPDDGEIRQPVVLRPFPVLRYAD